MTVDVTDKTAQRILGQSPMNTLFTLGDNAGTVAINRCAPFRVRPIMAVYFRPDYGRIFQARSWPYICPIMAVYFT